jgi:hypothetical protein
MGFGDRVDEDIVKGVTEDYKKAASWLPFSALEIKKVFSEEELKELDAFSEEMKKATSENEQKARLVNNIARFGGTVVKLLKLGRVLP